MKCWLVVYCVCVETNWIGKCIIRFHEYQIFLHAVFFQQQFFHFVYQNFWNIVKIYTSGTMQQWMIEGNIACGKYSMGNISNSFYDQRTYTSELCVTKYIFEGNKNLMLFSESLLKCIFFMRSVLFILFHLVFVVAREKPTKIISRRLSIKKTIANLCVKPID